MKHFKLATLAAASLLATGFAAAGTLQVTPIQYAAETVVTGTAMIAPVFSYSLAAPISTTSSPVFTADFSLNNAVWNACPALGDIALVSPDGATSLQATACALTTKTTTNDTLNVTFTVLTGANGGLVALGGGAVPTAGFTFPVGSNVIVGRTVAPQVKGTAAMVAPANSCTDTTADTTLTVVVKNALGAETETVAPLAVLSSSVYLRSSNSLSVLATAPGGTLETSKIDVTTPSVGKLFTTDADTGTNANSNVVAIAKVVFSDRGAYKDAAIGAVGNYTVATGFAAAGASTAVAGNVSVDKLNLRVTGTFNTAGTVYMSSTSDCLNEITVATGAVAALATGTIATAGARAALTATSATFTGLQITAAGFPLVAAKPTAYVCYKRDVTTNTVINPSAFAIDLTTSSVTHTAESGSPVCGSALYNLAQNGVKIDLRNVVAKNSPAYVGGWRSFVRIINTDEAQAATVTGQVITPAGVVLAGGTLASGLAPRAYISMSTDDIETALTGSASAAFSSPTSGINTRLRLTSPTSSLRVQNYLFNPSTGAIIEVSSAQGDEQPGNAIFTNSVTEEARK